MTNMQSRGDSWTAIVGKPMLIVWLVFVDHDLSSEDKEVDAANAANGDGDDMDVTNSDFDEYSWCGTWEMREFDICLICCVGLSCAIGL